MATTVYQVETDEYIVSRGPGPGANPRAAFIAVEEAASRADKVRGDVDQFPADAVIYIGETTGKHYYRSHALRELPDDFREAITEAEFQIVDGATGGWSNWEGRPEWSDWYLDLTDAEVIGDA